MTTAFRLTIPPKAAGTGLLVGAVAIGLIVVATAAQAADIDTRRGGYAERGAPAGPIIGGIAANNGYYAYGPYAAPGAPAPWGELPWSGLYGPAVPVARGCYVQRQRIWTEYGWRWRKAPICY